MEPNKFDNQIKEKLDGRTIQPSAQAWDRLDAMLTVAEKPKRNSNWMYVAASFVGFLLIASVFFSQTEELIDSEKKDVVIGYPIISKVSGSPINNEINEKSSNKKGSDKIANVTGEEDKKTAAKSNRIKEVKERVLINKEKSNENLIAQNSDSKIENSNTQIISQKTISLKSNDASVDELVALAEQSSKKESLTKKASIKVDASRLLSLVDGELELSFREKVISKLNKNYQSVKVAFNNRNLE
jgi:hypothetical protein